MIRRLLIALSLVLPVVLSVVLLNVGVASARHHHWPPPPTTTTTVPPTSTTTTTTPPTSTTTTTTTTTSSTTTTTTTPPPPNGSLPGEVTYSGGANSYVFVTNDGIDYSEPSFSSVPADQALAKQGGLTLDRVWTYSGDAPSVLTSKLNAAKAVGMTCYLMLGSITPSDLAWEESTINTAEPLGCHLFEFGNEPNSNGGTSAYVTDWLNNIPQLRALPVCAASNACLFGGPAVAYPTAYEGEGDSSDVAYFLAKTAATSRADFISYHDYPCNGASAWGSSTTSSQIDCLNHITDDNNGYGGAAGTCTLTPGSCTVNANGALGVDQSQVIGWEKQYYGTTIPTGISEYNFDPGSSTLGAWANDSQFMYDWQVAATDAFVANGLTFATQFTSLNYSGYGALDMFSDSAPYGPKAQFYGIVSEVEKYGGPSTLAIPNPLP